jgi:hypothetical protein
MARSEKHEKNLQKVQDMLDGNQTGKLQVGMHTPENVHEGRKVGDVWEDSDGVKWEQKEGYRSKVSVMPEVGIFPHKCSDCGDNCDSDKRNKATFLRMGRCYYCQLNFEVDLKAKGKWEEWVMEQEAKRWEGFLKEQGLELDELRGKIAFDKRVANALANGNVEMTIKKNKS